MRDFLKRNLAYYKLLVENKSQLSSTHRPRWTSPRKSQPTPATRNISKGLQSSTSELPLETGEVYRDAKFEDQHRRDPLRRNLNYTDYEETAANKKNYHSGMSADPTKIQVFALECVDLEKESKQPGLMSGVAFPISNNPNKCLPTDACLGEQNSDVILKSSASQPKLVHKCVGNKKRYAEALPQQRVRGLRAAKKSYTEEEQDGRASTIPRMNASGPAEYATEIKTGKSSSSRIQQQSTESSLMTGIDRTAIYSKINSPSTGLK